jgi:hypothetical protein
MFFSSQSSGSLNALSADSLNASSLQTTSAAISLSTSSSGLTDPLQQSNRLAGPSTSLDSATTAGIIIVSGTPESAIDLSSVGISDNLASLVIQPQLAGLSSLGDLVSPIPNITHHLEVVNILYLQTILL